MIDFDQIDARLDALGLNRAWLAEKSGRSAGAIRAALAPNAVPKNRSELLQRALSETIEREEQSQQTKVVLPERISIEVSKAEFDAWCRAYKASPHDTLEDWTIASLNSAADRWFQQQREEQERAWRKRVPLKVVEEGPHFGSGFWTDLRGGIAAGAPISSHVVEEPIPVAREYPADHYALRVFGESMEPRIPDGSTIIVKAWPAAKGTPRKGTIVVYSDAMGSTLKEFGYRKAKAGEEADSMGNVPVLRSINKAFPEVQTLESGKIDAVFVEVL